MSRIEPWPGAGRVPYQDEKPQVIIRDDRRRMKRFPICIWSRFDWMPAGEVTTRCLDEHIERHQLPDGQTRPPRECPWCHRLVAVMFWEDAHE